MNSELTVIGGTYIEVCNCPSSNELYGSGLRAAISLSSLAKIKLVTCLGQKELESFKSICETFNLSYNFEIIKKTIIFDYFHPLSRPKVYEDPDQRKTLTSTEGENVLYYGMVEASAKITGNYVVYDPQNHVSFKETRSTAKHLGLSMNLTQALELSNSEEDEDIYEMGKKLLKNEGAEVVIIKAGAQGAFLIEPSQKAWIPVYKTNSVWPIGSGDIFSAFFAFNWAVQKKSAEESANLASQFTASYCQEPHLPLSNKIVNLSPLPQKTGARSIYIAGPFFTLGQKWIVDEVRKVLIEMGNNVFSPYHDLGTAEEQTAVEFSRIAQLDLDVISRSDIIFAILDGADPGTIFEIGYARSLNKRVVIFCEQMSQDDLLMFVGSNCEIYTDFSTAIYSTSW